MGNGYMTPDWIEAVRDVGIVLGVITAFVAAVIGVGKFLIVKPLQQYIDERTPMNGGKSLRELHTKMDALTARVLRIETEVIRLDHELEDLDEHNHPHRRRTDVFYRGMDKVEE